MYDAITLFMRNQLWKQAISAIDLFQTKYPNHKNSSDVTKKLSIAYLNSDQDLKAAEQFERISMFESNQDLKMAALWQAAELYESQKNYKSAIRSYSKYANTYKKPHEQYLESMVKLVGLYDIEKKSKLKEIWQNRILTAANKITNKDKTKRINLIIALTSLDMARKKNLEFSQYKLVEPLKSNLRKKKKAMQQSIKLYGQASSFGFSEISTESTFAIAQIYQDFGNALLNSERPHKLKGEELEQYNILIEDQAYPFEDKAIEFHEINLSRIKSNIFDDWISKSLTQLKQLFPVKYARKNKVEGFIDVKQ
jgi:tetratricopeptide (TPR) repeat protein